MILNAGEKNHFSLRLFECHIHIIRSMITLLVEVGRKSVLFENESACVIYISLLKCMNINNIIQAKILVWEWCGEFRNR